MVQCAQIMARRRVAITGIGLITPLGMGIEPFWEGLVEGRSAVAPVTHFDPGDLPTVHVGEMPHVDFDEHFDPTDIAFWSRVTKYAVLGSRMAAKDAGIETFDPSRTGVILGTGYGSIADLEDVYSIWIKRGWKRVKPVSVPRSMPNSSASHVAIAHRARGINFTVSTACSSGAIAAGLAVQQIRAGALDACITGGTDAIMNHSTLSVWCALRVLGRRKDSTASRPFSADRDGLVFAEGTSILILEDWESAKARGAHIHAEIVGVGATCDAVNIVGPDPVGELEAIAMAFEDAALKPTDIGYVSAHGTGTKANDANESRVMKEAFGSHARAIPVSSIKGHIGHTMGAAGAIEIAATALALQRQKLPPTLHYVPGDPDCDLDYVTEGARDHAFEYAMTNSFGFGGQNSVLILRKA